MSGQLSIFEAPPTVPSAPQSPAAREVAGLIDRVLADAENQLELLRWADITLVSSSGGKDSQAMLSHIVVLATLAGVLDRLVVVHCDLGIAEWDDTRELAERQAAAYGLRFEVVTREQGNLFQHVIERHEKLRAKGDTTTPAWPSSQARYCTSDHKRGQVRKLMTRLVAEFGDLGRPVRILNCMGMRAEESPARKKRKLLEFDRDGSNGKRTVLTWLPLHRWKAAQVWAEIARSGLPYSPVYDWGMTRLSCSFCVLASEADLTCAARLLPGKAQKLVALEQTVGHSFKKDLSIAEIVRRAAALDAAEGPIVKHPPGTAMAGFIGKAKTRRYLERLALAA